MLHNRSQPPNLHLVVVLTIMSVSQTTQHRWQHSQWLVNWNVVERTRLRHNPHQLEEVWEITKSHSRQPAPRPAFWYCQISLSCTNITPILPASIMNISFSIVWYLDTNCVHSPTGSFNSLRAYTLPADAYELPVSSGQSIGPNVTLSRVASRRVAGIMDTATQSITQSPAAPTYQHPVPQHRLPNNNHYTHSMAQSLSDQLWVPQFV